jgi:hypothetical protein
MVSFAGKHAKGAAMTTETDFLTRDIPGPKPYGRAVFAVAPMIDWTDRRDFSF